MSDECECTIWEKGLYRRKCDETDDQEKSVKLEHVISLNMTKGGEKNNTFSSRCIRLGTTPTVMVTTSVLCTQKNSKLSSCVNNMNLSILE